MKMTMDQWDKQVGQYLTNIRIGCDMCESAVTQLVYRPVFETLAEGDLEALEGLLTSALTIVRRTRAAMLEKPRVD